MKINDENIENLVPSFLLFSAKDDKERYINYKNNIKKTSDEYEKDAMEIISLLEKLGFSLDEVGTYLYKELILALYYKIINREEIDKESVNKIINNITTDFFEISKDQYQELVKESIDCIDGDNVDIELNSKIFKNSLYNIDENAVEMASYYMNNNQEKNKNKKGLFLSRVFNFR